MDARTIDGRTRGHVVVQHVFIRTGTVRVGFDVDCLAVDGGAVTVTGPVVTATATPVGGGPATTGPTGRHPETGLTFYPADEHGEYPADEHGERRVGWSGANPSDPSKPAGAIKCTPVPPSLWGLGGETVAGK